MTYLNFSEELYRIFYRANELSGEHSIELKHILISLFVTNTLVSNIFDTTNVLSHYNKTKLFRKKYLFKFSRHSLILISNLLVKKNIINTIDFFIALLHSDNVYIKYFFKYIKPINLYIYQNFILKSNIMYIINLFYYIKFKKILIIDRDYEIVQIENTLVRRFKNNIILLGETGIGRFSIIKGVFYKKNNKEFYIFDFIKLCSLISYDNLNTHKQQIYNWILSSFSTVLILNKLETISDFELITPIFNTIFLLIKQKKLQTIITTTVSKFSLFINSNIILYNLYELLTIKELPTHSVKKILQYMSPQMECFYKIKLMPDIINLILNISNLIYPNKVFPIKAIELLEIICSKFILTYSTNMYLTKIHFEQIISTMSNIVIFNNKQKKLIKNFKFLLQKRIFGQTFIIDKINNVLTKTLSGFKSINKPLGSWLLCGPSGTGKTELAKSITEILFGHENKMIRFDMSEFMEKHSVSKLIGSPPGYVGYGDRGLLTEAVYRQPNCLLLFDEIEKAHPDILNIMLQILDDGRLTDSTGRVVNFTNVLIILTSNLGCPKDISEFKKELGATSVGYKVNEQIIMKSIKQYFKPELINRIQGILIFQPLEFNVLLLILNKFIKQFFEQLKIQKFPINLIVQENLKKYIVKLSISPLYGARPLKRIFDELIVEPTINILFKTNINKPHLLICILDNTNTILYNLIPKI